MRILLYFSVNYKGDMIYIDERKIDDTHKNAISLADTIDDLAYLNEDINFKNIEVPTKIGTYQAVIQCEDTIDETRYKAISCTPLVLC